MSKHDTNCCQILFQNILDLLVQLQLRVTYVQDSTVLSSDFSLHDTGCMGLVLKLSKLCTMLFLTAKLYIVIGTVMLVS